MLAAVTLTAFLTAVEALLDLCDGQWAKFTSDWALLSQRACPRDGSLFLWKSTHFETDFSLLIETIGSQVVVWRDTSPEMVANFGQSNLGQSNLGQFISGSGVCRGWAPNPEKIGPKMGGALKVATAFGQT